MNEESKERSRQNSIQSSHQGDANGAMGGLGRFSSTGSGSRTSSYANSAVGVNGAARWGGYSPGGYISSPVGSVHSGSWPRTSSARKASASGASRLGQMVKPVHEGKPLDSPLASNSTSYFDLQSSRRPSRQPSQSSFAQRYDQIASQIEDSLLHVPPSPPKHALSTHAGRNEEHAARQISGSFMPPDRPPSTDTYQEAQAAFKDFDGVHFSPTTEEFVELDQNGDEVRRVSARSSSGGMANAMDAASLLRTPRVRPMSYAEPPPGENMVYYPAPVPRMLNLPKRLSQLPAANVQAKRRSQVLSQLPPDTRQSAPWLPQMDFGSGTPPSHRSQNSGSHHSQHSGKQESEHPRSILNERMSLRNIQNLPPQLRASIFFDHQSLQQDVDIKSESAVATLDNILAASATAPVSAFTDHPFAGDVRRSVYAPELSAARRSTATLGATALGGAEAMRNKRSSTIGSLFKRSSSGDKLGEQLQNNGSRASFLLDFNEGGKKLQKRKSQMSLADGLDQPRAPGNENSDAGLASGFIAQAQNAEHTEDDEHVASGSRLETMMSGQKLTESQQIAEDWKEAEAQEDLEQGEPVYAQPTTLLAELQVRKANLKSRNRTAVSAFPNGMHSTLLELDAVEQIQNRKRKERRVPLAWEEQNLPEDEVDANDDVPLGMLFPGKEGLLAGKRRVGDGNDWDRPLGLMEKRELEDNEPLRSRRNRLQGLPPGFGRPPSPERRLGLLPDASELHLAGQPDGPLEGEAEDETAGETLGQRLRRLKTEEALDNTISDFAPKQGSRPASTFADDLLSQFGGLDLGSKDATAGAAAPAPAPEPEQAGPAEEDETLGQRRARLQREREASGEQPAPQTRPNVLRNNSSFANLLATNPVVSARKPSRENHQPAQGTLLHTNAQQQAKQKAQIFNTNVRSSSYGMDRPHTAGGAGLLSQQMKGATGFGGVYNNGLGGLGAQATSTLSTPGMFGMNGAASYFASPTGGYGKHPQGMMMGYPQQPMMTPYQMSAGLYPTTMMGGAYGGYGGAHYMTQMPYGMAAEEPLDPKQRDAIDQWRLSVAPGV